MDRASTVIAGIVIPSSSPVFIAVVGVHIVAALICVAAAIVAMLSTKRGGRHSTFGQISPAAFERRAVSRSTAAEAAQERDCHEWRRRDRIRRARRQLTADSRPIVHGSRSGGVRCERCHA